MKLSVVIPVYRVEATLHRCVESVLSQQVPSMEVILVDDGSPDRCPQLCDEWATKDRRIRVIHQANGGLSAARNAGIERATGQLITFVDSDDYLAPGTYAPLLQMMDDADILEYSIAGKAPYADRIYHDMTEYWLQGRAYQHTYACNKIFRRELFDNVKFPQGRVFEDVYTLPQLLKHTQTVRTTPKGTYHYCFNPQGITAQADGQALSQLLDAHLQNKMPVDDTYYLYLLNIQMDVWEQTGHPIKLPQRTLDASLLSGKEKLKANTLNILGIKRLCRINKLIHLVKKPSR